MRERTRSSRLRAGALAALLSAALVAEAAPPAGTAPAGELAFAGARGGDWEIFAVRGGAEANLSRKPGADDLEPTWAPDGERFAFARRSPSGRASIWVAASDGSNAVQITAGPGSDRQPAWSPDGQWIAFVRSFPPQGTSQIFLVSPDGERLRKLTATGRGVINASPAWSNDSFVLAFSSDRGGGFPRIHLMHRDGTGVQRVTDGSHMDVNPSWSPDGTQIAFERFSGGSADVWIVGADGSSPRNVTASPDDESDPAWSPDGTQLAFVGAPAGGGDRDVFVISPDGSGRERVTTGPGADVSPAWRPAPGAQRAAADARALLAPAAPGAEREAADLEPSRTPMRRKRKPPPRRVTVRVAPGVTLIKLYKKGGPNRVFALRIDPARREVDVGLANGVLPGAERTSVVARRLGALAAVNGDFALSGGRPAGIFAADGDLKQTSFVSGPVFGSRNGGRDARIADPTAAVIATENEGTALRIDRWNFGQPVLGEIAAYTEVGSSAELPPAYACGVRLVTAGPLELRQERVVRGYTVDRRGCFSSRISRDGGVVLAAQPGSAEAALLRTLVPGESLEIGWELGWGGVSDVVAGYPVLVQGGRTKAGPCGEAICGQHPRTGLGITKGGQLLLVVVDGRQKRWSVGMTLDRFAGLMKGLGAVSAMNLDGGGSSTMVVRGKVINRPSDGRERPVSSVVAVLRGADRGEQRPVAGRARAGGGDAALLDPASTGGLLDALARGAFGPQLDLSGRLLRALHRFRAAA